MVKKLVKCTPEYWEFVRILRNDPKVQEGFIISSNITSDQQKKYMEVYSGHYRIALLDNIPAGYVGVIEDDIRICTHPDYQGLGIGKFMLKEIMKEFPSAYGKVKIDNEASKNLFKNVGFTESFIIFTKNNNG
jgi:ribosomal protein S18 acetylase RimI-like enzyme